MPYTTIADSEIDADSPITVSVMTRLRDNASVGKAPRGWQRTQGTGTWTAPVDVENIRITIAGGGATGYDNPNVGDDRKGGNGGAAIVWARVSPGQVLTVTAGAAGAQSRVNGIVTAAPGDDAIETANGDQGDITLEQAGATFIRLSQVDFRDASGFFGEGGTPGSGRPGVVVIEY